MSVARNAQLASLTLCTRRVVQQQANDEAAASALSAFFLLRTSRSERCHCCSHRTEGGLALGRALSHGSWQIEERAETARDPGPDFHALSRSRTQQTADDRRPPQTFLVVLFTVDRFVVCMR